MLCREGSILRNYWTGAPWGLGVVGPATSTVYQDCFGVRINDCCFPPQYETALEGDSTGSLQQMAYHTVNRRYREFLNLQTRLEEKPELRKFLKSQCLHQLSVKVLFPLTPVCVPSLLWGYPALSGHAWAVHDGHVLHCLCRADWRIFFFPACKFQCYKNHPCSHLNHSACFCSSVP